MRNSASVFLDKSLAHREQHIDSWHFHKEVIFICLTRKKKSWEKKTELFLTNPYKDTFYHHLTYELPIWLHVNFSSLTSNIMGSAGVERLSVSKIRQGRKTWVYFNRPHKIISNDFSIINSHKCSQHNNIKDAILLVYIIAIIACPRQAKFSVNYLAVKCARKSIKVWVAEQFTIQCRVSGQTYQITALLHSISRNNCRQHLETLKKKSKCLFSVR